MSSDSDEDGKSGIYYDEIEIEDMDYNPENESYYYPCPCGDKFVITKQELIDGEFVGRCPSCTLIIKVIYDPEDLQDLQEGDGSDSD